MSFVNVLNEQGILCEQGSDDWQWLKEKGGTGSLSTRNATFYECVKMTYGYMQLNKDVTGSNDTFN